MPFKCWTKASALIDLDCFKWRQIGESPGARGKAGGGEPFVVFAGEIARYLYAQKSEISETIRRCLIHL